MKIIEKIIDVSTGLENIVEREATAEEIAEMEAIQLAAEAAAKEAAAKEAARQALLDKLGITAEEAALLLG